MKKVLIIFIFSIFAGISSAQQIVTAPTEAQTKRDSISRSYIETYIKKIVGEGLASKKGAADSVIISSDESEYTLLFTKESGGFDSIVVDHVIWVSYRSALLWIRIAQAEEKRRAVEKQLCIRECQAENEENRKNGGHGDKKCDCDVFIPNGPYYPGRFGWPH